MKIFRILVLPVIIAIVSTDCVDGMMPEKRHESELGKRGRDGEIEGKRLMRGRADHSVIDEFVYLLSNDGAVVPVRKDVGQRLSILINTTISICEEDERIEVRSNFSEIVLKVVVRLITEEYDLLRVGMPIQEIINKQQAELSLLYYTSEFKGVVEWLDCWLLRHVLGMGSLERLFDYFTSGILPLSVLGMTPETLNVTKIFEESMHPRATQRIAIKALKDPGLCRFYQRLPRGALKTTIHSMLSKALIQHLNNLGAMPIELAAISCLLDLGFKSQILRAFDVNEDSFDRNILSVIATNSKTLNVSSFGGGLVVMSDSCAKFIIECARLLQVEELNLSGNHLTAVPAEISQLRSLEVLNLGGNNLAAFPVEIGQLRSLKRLNLSVNDLVELPSEIGQLRLLERLNLAVNDLVGLPAEIGQLRSLKWLDVYANSLTELPAEIGQNNRSTLTVSIARNPCARTIGRDVITYPGHPEE